MFELDWLLLLVNGFYAIDLGEGQAQRMQIFAVIEKEKRAAARTYHPRPQTSQRGRGHGRQKGDDSRADRRPGRTITT